MNFSKNNNKLHKSNSWFISKTKITTLLLLFIASIMGVNAQITKGKSTIPIATRVKKPLKNNPNSIRATFVAPSGQHYFFTEKRYFRYSKEHGLNKIADVKPNWGGVPDNVDAALVDLKNKKAYFFKGSKYNRYSFDEKGLDNPELVISRFWKGVPSNLDAAVVHPNGKYYFFKGNEYFRYDPRTKKVDNQALIRTNWKGVPDNIEAALLHANGKIYFLKGNTYFRYNIKAKKVDKSATVGKDGWKGLDFNKKNFTKKIPKPVVAAKDNIRLKVTLTRIKSIQARDSDNIADFKLQQFVYYETKGNHKIAIEKNIKSGENQNLLDSKEYLYGDKKTRHFNSIIDRRDRQLHVREGDENYFINNSLVFELSPQEFNDDRAKFNMSTGLLERSSYTDNKHISNIFKPGIDVKIKEVLAYLQNPNSSKYGGNYFKGGRDGKTHEYGAFGDVMWFKKGSNNSLIGHLEFGDNNKETYVRLYYRFELIP